MLSAEPLASTIGILYLSASGAAVPVGEEPYGPRVRLTLSSLMSFSINWAVRFGVVVLELHFVGLAADLDPAHLIDLVDGGLVAVARVLPFLGSFPSDRDRGPEHDRVGREGGHGAEQEPDRRKQRSPHRKPPFRERIVVGAELYFHSSRQIHRMGRRHLSCPSGARRRVVLSSPRSLCHPLALSCHPERSEGSARVCLSRNLELGAGSERSEGSALAVSNESRFFVAALLR